MSVFAGLFEAADRQVRPACCAANGGTADRQVSPTYRAARIAKGLRHPMKFHHFPRNFHCGRAPF